MLGSNPSADSVASTDTGGCYGIPLSLSGLMKLPIGRGTKALNPGGAGAKPPQAASPTHTFLLKYGRTLIMHRNRLEQKVRGRHDDDSRRC